MINKKSLAALLIPILIISIGVYGHRLFFDNTKGNVTTRISFNFDGVDEGLNPHGGSFDAQQIKNDKVIEEVIDQLNLDIDPELLSRNIRIAGVVPNDAIDRIIPKVSESKDINLEGIKGSTYNPTQYDVSLILNKDFKLNKKDSKAVVDKLVEVYQDLFVRKYKDTQAIEAAITPIDPEKYDYSEYISLAESQISTIKSYLSSKQKNAKDFKSPNTNLGFGDLIARVELIEDVDIGNIKALIDSFMVTKDIEKLSIVSENMISKMQLEKEKYDKQADDLTRAAKTYEKDKIVISGNGESILGLKDEDDKDTKEQDLYDQLVQQSIEVKARSNKTVERQQYYKNLLSKINEQKESDQPEQVKPYLEEAEEGIEHISSKMDGIMEDIKLTVDDYYTEEVFKGSVTSIRGVKYQSSFRNNLVKDTLKIVMLSILVIMIGYTYLLAKEEFGAK